MAGIDPFRVINGTFGSIYLDGQWLANFTRCEATVEPDLAEMKLSGDEMTKHKVTGYRGSGTISGFKVTSVLLKAVLDNPKRRFELIAKLEDPESTGKERVRIPGVIFNRYPVANWRAGEVVEEEWSFVFDEKPELLDAIS